MIQDLAAVSGLLLVGAGVAFIHWPTALIVVGLLLLGGGVAGHFRSRPAEGDREHGAA